MWRIWLIFDPRRSLVAVLAFCFGMVMLNHLIQLSTPRYGSWLMQPRPAPRASIDMPKAPAVLTLGQVQIG